MTQSVRARRQPRLIHDLPACPARVRLDADCLARRVAARGEVAVWLLRNRWGYLPIVLYCEDRCCCDWAIRPLTPDESSITPWTTR